MINDSFDNSKPFLDPYKIYKNAPKNDMVTLVTFSGNILNDIIEKYHASLFLSYKTTNGKQDVYKFNYEGKDYLVYMTGIGATLASTIMIEVAIMTGSHKFVYFGSCGVLDEDKCRGKVIVPNEAYRDEGISYHYLPGSDYVEVKNAKVVSDILLSQGHQVVNGRTWTTDAIYMETVNKVKSHKKDGCISVEMEISGVEAVARFYHLDNYHILFSADSLASEEDWDQFDFANDKEVALQERFFEIALSVAKEL